MRAFDFDQTIYDGYTGRDFCFFMTGRRPWMIVFFPYLMVVGLLTLFRLVSMKRSAELLLWPFIRTKKLEQYVARFWDKRENRIMAWYKEIHRDDDVIVSATPRFFLAEICRRIGVKHVVCTEMDPKKSKIIDPYCYRSGKWERFTEAFGADAVLDEYYTDTMRDKFMLEKAAHGYYVRKGVVTQVH